MENCNNQFRRIALTMLTVCMTSLLWAATPTLYIWKNGAVVYQVPISEVDSISFIQPPTQVDPTVPDHTRQNPDYLYDLTDVPQITITVTQANWNTYLNNFDANPNNDLYVPASWTMTKGDGRVYYRDSVGLRPRGNTSRVRPEGYSGQAHSASAQWHHAHFGVKFTEYETGQRFFGSDRVILKWFKEDPTYVREVFCYDLMRRFGVWSAPRSSYCRLSIQVEGDPNPVYMGVYQLIENPRKGWLKNRKERGLIADNDGNMWKAAWGATLGDANQGNMGIESLTKSYTYTLKLVKDSLVQAKQELADFINGLYSHASGSTSLQNWLEQHMDVDLFLRAMAVEAMVGHWDDYWSGQNNYFIYFDTNHKFYYIPFDMDNTLGTGSSAYGNPGNKDMLNWGPLDNSRLLVQRVMSIDAYQQRYKQYISELATTDSLMSAQGAMARVQELQNRIASYVSNDTGEDMYIYDSPASWGNYGYYRLLSGNVGDGQSSESNYFKTKVNSISWLDEQEPETPATQPTVSAQDGKTVVVIYFDDIPCNEVTLAGKYQWTANSYTHTASWGSNSDNSQNEYVNLSAISGYPGWYKATFDRPSNGTSVFKMVQLTQANEFDWSYQWGLNSVSLLSGDAEVVENEWNQQQVEVNSNSSVIYLRCTAWMGSPCN